MVSKRVETVIATAQTFNCLPSEVMGIEDEYTAYCFNEACMNVLARIKDGQKPDYNKIKRKNKPKKKHYSNFRDFYKDVI